VRQVLCHSFRKSCLAQTVISPKTEVTVFARTCGLTLIRGGGHFPGGSMLHWAAGAEGKGVLCSADIAIVNLDRKSFAFMRSLPNHIPLSEKAVRAIGAALMPLAFDRVYSYHFERVMHCVAKQILQSSVERYVAAIGCAYDRA